jgi:hypothetical protein
MKNPEDGCAESDLIPLQDKVHGETDTRGNPASP